MTHSNVQTIFKGLELKYLVNLKCCLISVKPHKSPFMEQFLKSRLQGIESKRLRRPYPSHHPRHDLYRSSLFIIINFRKWSQRLGDGLDPPSGHDVQLSPRSQQLSQFCHLPFHRHQVLQCLNFYLYLCLSVSVSGFKLRWSE